MALAKAEGLLYVETSAKDGTGVEEAFARTAREVLGRTHGGEGKDGKKVSRTQKAIAKMSSGVFADVIGMLRRRIS